MVKLTVKYENEVEKMKIIEALAKGFKFEIKGKPHKSGNYYRVYVDIEL